ncbi:hypothetical protein HK097_005950, partial [Rhizophlyctis rosea]
ASGAAQPRVFEIEPIDEIMVGKDVKIKSMIKSPGSTNEYLLVDENGYLFRLDTKKRSTERIMSFHSGAVVAMDTSPLAHSMASLGADGSLRVYDYITKTVVGQVKYPAGGSAMVYAPESLDATGATLLTGHTDGILRILSHTPPTLSPTSVSFHLHHIFKPHKSPITTISISPDCTTLATASLDRTLFLFKITATPPPPLGDHQPPLIFNSTNIQITPVGFVQMESPVVCVSFSPDNHLGVEEIEPVGDEEGDEAGGEGGKEGDEEDLGDAKRCFVVLENGKLVNLIVPPPETVDNSLTYEFPEGAVKMARWTLDVPVPKPATPAKVITEGGEQQEEGKEDEGGKVEEKKEEKKEERGTSAARKARGLVIENESPVTRVVYLEGGYFLIAVVNGDGESEVRACKFGKPDMSRLLLVHTHPITHLSLSHTGKHLLLGTSNGLSILRKFRLDDILLYRWSLHHETFSHYSQSYESEESNRAIEASKAERRKLED